MSTRTVTQSVANASRHSAFYELVKAFNHLVNYRPLGPPNFEVDTNFDIQNGDALDYVNGGELKTLATDQNFDTGTSKVIAADRWGAALLSVDSSGSGVVTWAPDDYADEDAAIAALQDVDLPSNNTPLGYVTVETASGQSWTAGTDALQTGTGGNPSDDTNYYNIPLQDTLEFRETGAPS